MPLPQRNPGRDTGFSIKVRLNFFPQGLLEIFQSGFDGKTKIKA
jgi:hypothetical protein